MYLYPFNILQTPLSIKLSYRRFIISILYKIPPKIENSTLNQKFSTHTPTHPSSHHPPNLYTTKNQTSQPLTIHSSPSQLSTPQPPTSKTYAKNHQTPPRPTSSPNPFPHPPHPPPSPKI
jgi:hypothetical protein